MSRKSVVVFALFFAWVLPLTAVEVLDECPEHMKREISTADTSIISGDRSDSLPAGWMVFAKHQSGDHASAVLKGLWKSPLGTYDPVLVPNTGNDQPTLLKLYVVDGSWMMYWDLAQKKWFLIRPDGANKTEVPIGAAPVAAFYYDSPKETGVEIAFRADDHTVKATVVDLSGSAPTFGATRAIFQLTGNTLNGEVPTVGNHLFTGRWRGLGPGAHDPVYVTIPDDGNGIATDADMYQYQDIPDSAFYGCDYVIYKDGSLILQNDGNQGAVRAPYHFPDIPNVALPASLADQLRGKTVDLECAPVQKQVNMRMDHKGFMITKFMEVGDPAVSPDALADDPTYAVSVNFVPDAGRYPTGATAYQTGDWTDWNWGNWKKYIIGTAGCYKTGCGYSTYSGIWVCDWTINHWTLVSPKDLGAGCPVLYITDTEPTAVAAPPRTLADKLSFTRAMQRQASVYDMQGRRLGRSAQIKRHLRPGVYLVRAGNVDTRISVVAK
jgi:hypothetical protein